ncbi:hypothetical protein FPQ18DRAFT_394735 [Pyronema domesticum]|nr:hypothetical protein FPQ18DRAFT_394735 [Pyronema domesticum]
MPNSSNPPPAPHPSHRELPGEPWEPWEPGEPGGGDKSTSSFNSAWVKDVFGFELSPESKEAVDKLPTFGTGGAPKRPETNPASQRPKTPKTYADLVATERRGGGTTLPLRALGLLPHQIFQANIAVFEDDEVPPGTLVALEILPGELVTFQIISDEIFASDVLPDTPVAFKVLPGTHVVLKVLPVTLIILHVLPGTLVVLNVFPGTYVLLKVLDGRTFPLRFVDSAIFFFKVLVYEDVICSVCSGSRSSWTGALILRGNLQLIPPPRISEVKDNEVLPGIQHNPNGSNKLSRG